MGARWERFKDGFRQWANEIPKCPACHGTGKPTGQWQNFTEIVHFQGVDYIVCHNCKGSGYV